jgi:hypothetical protein
LSIRRKGKAKVMVSVLGPFTVARDKSALLVKRIYVAAEGGVIRILV